MSSPDPSGQRAPKRRGGVHSWVRMYAVVLEAAAYPTVLGYAGWWMDKHRGWSPWGLFGGLMLGMAFGIYRIYREGQRLDR